MFQFSDVQLIQIQGIASPQHSNATYCAIGSNIRDLTCLDGVWHALITVVLASRLIFFGTGSSYILFETKWLCDVHKEPWMLVLKRGSNKILKKKVDNFRLMEVPTKGNRLS